MGINHYFSNYSGFFYFIYVILAYLTFPVCTTTPFAKSCGLYGAPPCRYLPAPPGQTPSCARPGKTYCEYVDNYPIYLVKHLVQKWGYEAKNLLVDETLDNFAADTPVFYDPAYIFPQRNSNHGTDLNGYNYERPPYESRRNSENINYNTDTYRYPKSPTTEVPKYLLYASSSNLNKSKFSSFGSSTVKSTPNNPTLWLQRFVRELAKKSSLSYDENPRLVIDATVESVGKYSTNSSSIRNVPFNVDTSTSSRAKRQSPGRTTLCQTTFQFITPQAALNSQGNWMFVVNEVNTARQTVKAELCASNTCTNLCQLPNGYNSKCEQKFVQKRLIALQGSGQNLYTDTFWFPSCCVCTISAN